MKDVDELMDGYKTDGNILSVASGTEADGAIYDIAFKNLQKNPLEKKNYLFATNSYLNLLWTIIRKDALPVTKHIPE
jgi:hypothetical protein